jgi:hypothetical protein
MLLTKMPKRDPANGEERKESPIRVLVAASKYGARRDRGHDRGGVSFPERASTIALRLPDRGR